MNPISVSIITFNEEKNIGRCIDSVLPIADEIVILDSFSTDKTCVIAAEKGAKVIQQSFAGYIEQKNNALALTTHNLVLCLDADEALDALLRNSIEAVKSGTPAAGYSMNRCTFYCEKFIRHGSWYPDRKLRLFDKRQARWGGVNPHDKVEFTTPRQTVHLKGDILHYSYYTIEEHIQQNNRFSSIAAAAYFKRGRRTSLFKMVVNPFWSFVQCYLIKGGFLDGFYGYVIARNVAHMTLLKHIKLYQLQRAKNKQTGG